MLVLSRRLGEEIVIDGNIRISVLAIKGSQVRIGVTAPASVPVFRRELVSGELGSPSEEPHATALAAQA